MANTSQQDYYRTLGVDRNAEAKKIKESYRELAFQHHPDRNEENPASAEMMKRINEAYAVLSNPEKRREYDAMVNRFGDHAHGHFRNTYSEQDIFSGSDVQHIFEEMARAFGLRGVDAIFRDFYGPGYQRFEFKHHGFHGRGFVFAGGLRRGRRPGMVQSGSPAVGRFGNYLLRKLTGLALPQTGVDISDTIVVPAQLARVGGPVAYDHQRRAKKLMVQIPPGTEQGQLIRLSGMGAAGGHGGPSGDLYLKVTFKKPFWLKIRDFIVSLLGR